MHSILAFFLPSQSVRFSSASLVKFAPIYSKNRSSPTAFTKHTDSLRSLLFFLSVFPLIRTLAAHHELAHTFNKPTALYYVCGVRLQSVHQSRRALKTQTRSESDRRRAAATELSRVSHKTDQRWCCPMKCCRTVLERFTENVFWRSCVSYHRRSQHTMNGQIITDDSEEQ